MQEQLRTIPDFIRETQRAGFTHTFVRFAKTPYDGGVAFALVELYGLPRPLLRNEKSFDMQLADSPREGPSIYARLGNVANDNGAIYVCGFRFGTLVQGRRKMLQTVLDAMVELEKAGLKPLSIGNAKLPPFDGGVNKDDPLFDGSIESVRRLFAEYERYFNETGYERDPPNMEDGRF